uniref:AAA+ ATPase domain-containing protein n=1 Tax=Erythrolobus australicus TaxID=1077150 RepID=A0A7S1TL81_9RHOD
MAAFVGASGSAFAGARVSDAVAACKKGAASAGRSQRSRAVVQMNTEYETPVTRRLSDALKERDVEARLEREEAERREREEIERREARQRKIQLMESIPENQPVGTVDEYMFKEGVQSVLEKLDYDLIGLWPVKARVREIAALLIVDKMRSKLGLETAVPSLHMSFTGAPGTGKTTVAMRVGEILQKMGYSRKGHLVVATRDDLVGQYVGHTAPKTKEQIKKAMGGVLLVDEAYYLYNASNDRDYGQESIEILLNVMETRKEDIVMVFAGYADKMERFYSYIPGMNSRIGNHIHFPDYEAPELLDIAKLMCRDLEYIIEPDAEHMFLEYIQARMQMPYFSNARTVRNAVDRARMRSAIRLFNNAVDGGYNNGMVSVQDLMTITADDVVSVQELMDRGNAIVE